LSDIAVMKNGTMPGLIERYNGQHVVSLTANLHDIALGKAGPRISQVVAQAGTAPKGVTVKMRGQIPSLEETITGLRTGLLLAIAIIFLLLAAYFQSLALALTVILTIPAVLCGVVFMLLLTGTTLNVQSFTGAIMATGIAVANSILLITFAERFRNHRRHDAACFGLGRGRVGGRTVRARRDRRLVALHLCHAYCFARVLHRL